MRRRKGGSASQKARFRKAVKFCKGRPLKSFRRCVSEKLKGR